MKTVCVVLVLFIGCNSGVLQADNNVLSRSISNTSEANTEETLDKTITIDERELFQSASDKQKNLSERSFIFLNQFIKVPRNNELDTFPMNLNGPIMLDKRLSQVNTKPNFVQGKVNPVKQLFIPHVKENILKSGYEPSLKFFQREQAYGLNDYLHNLQQVIQNKIPKPKVVVPFNKSEDINVNQKLMEYYRNTMANQSYKKPQRKISYSRPSNYNYLFSSYPMRRSPLTSVAQKKVNRDKIENLSNAALYDLDDKLLEGYIRDTLEEVPDIENNPKEKKETKLQVGILEPRYKNDEFNHSKEVIRVKQRVIYPTHTTSSLTQKLNTPN